MGIEFVPVWDELFVALIESEPPVQKNTAVYRIYTGYSEHPPATAPVQKYYAVYTIMAGVYRFLYSSTV